MKKESEQDYIISGTSFLTYGMEYYFPYFQYFLEYESPGDNRYLLPISSCVKLFLASINKRNKDFSIRINKIAIIHTQIGDNPVIRSSIVGDTYMYNLPQTTFEFAMGVPHNASTTTSIFESNILSVNSFKNWEQPFFQYFSDDGRIEWDFTNGTYAPGYGTFMKYSFNEYLISGAIIPKGYYLAYLIWMYRMVKIMISITIRDEY